MIGDELFTYEGEEEELRAERMLWATESISMGDACRPCLGIRLTPRRNAQLLSYFLCDKTLLSIVALVTHVMLCMMHVRMGDKVGQSFLVILADRSFVISVYFSNAYLT